MLLIITLPRVQRFIVMLSSSPILSTPLGSRVIMTEFRIFSCVGGNGMPASHMFVAPEGSKKGVGRGGGAGCWILGEAISERTAPWVLHKNPKGSSGFFPTLVNSAWLLSSFSSACVSLTFGAGLPESRLGQKHLHVSYFAMCIHMHLHKGYPMPVIPTQGSK